MQNTNAQYEEMQAMVNRLVNQNVGNTPAKPVPIGGSPKPKPVAVGGSRPVQKQPQQPAPQPRPTKKEPPQPTPKPERSRPDLVDFYQKTWICAASDKKFPFSERDVRVGLANHIYTSLKDINYEDDACTQRIKTRAAFDVQPSIGGRTDRLIAYLKEIGFNETLTPAGIDKIGEVESW